MRLEMVEMNKWFRIPCKNKLYSQSVYTINHDKFNDNKHQKQF